MVKHLSATQEAQVQSLGWEDALEKEMAALPSTLAWENPWMEKSGRPQSMGWQRVGPNFTFTFTFKGVYPSATDTIILKNRPL